MSLEGSQLSSGVRWQQARAQDVGLAHVFARIVGVDWCEAESLIASRMASLNFVWSSQLSRCQTVIAIAMGLASVSAARAQRSSVVKRRAQPPTVVLQTIDDGAPYAIRAAVQSPEEYRRLLPMLRRDSADAQPPLPAADFTTEMLIIAGMGMQGGIAGGIGIPMVREHDNVLDIDIVLRIPTGPCTAPAAINYPTIVVKVPKTRSTPVFHDKLTLYRCPF